MFTLIIYFLYNNVLFCDGDIQYFIDPISQDNIRPVPTNQNIVNDDNAHTDSNINSNSNINTNTNGYNDYKYNDYRTSRSFFIEIMLVLKIGLNVKCLDIFEKSKLINLVSMNSLK